MATIDIPPPHRRTYHFYYYTVDLKFTFKYNDIYLPHHRLQVKLTIYHFFGSAHR